MTIQPLGSGGSPAPKQTGNDAAKLEQRKEALQKEMRQVKDDKRMRPEEKKKKLAQLQRKLQEIDGQLRQVSREQQDAQNSETAEKETPKQQLQHARKFDAYEKDSDPQERTRTGIYKAKRDANGNREQ